MAHNRFRLFRLPFLALCIVLDFYSLHDIIQLSLCSKRSLRVAKKCWKKKGLVKTYLCSETYSNIEITYNESYYYLSVSSTQDLQDEQTISEVEDLHINHQQTHNIRVGDAVVPSIHKKTKTVTFWEDTFFGIEQIVNYTKYLFDVPISWIGLYKEEHPNEYMRTIKFIMSGQESVEECQLRGYGTPIDDCLTHLLDNYKVTGSLEVYGKLPPQFSNSWNITVDDLYIEFGLSITYQNLTNIDCQIFEIYHSSLSSENANQFLKHWQNGGNSRIKYLCIRINSIDYKTITSGIDTVLQRQRVFRSYKGMNNTKVSKFGGLDIRRNDGTIGAIFISGNKFEFGVDSTEHRP